MCYFFMCCSNYIVKRVFAFMSLGGHQTLKTFAHHLRYCSCSLLSWQVLNRKLPIKRMIWFIWEIRRFTFLPRVRWEYGYHSHACMINMKHITLLMLAKKFVFFLFCMWPLLLFFCFLFKKMNFFQNLDNKISSLKVYRKMNRKYEIVWLLT